MSAAEVKSWLRQQKTYNESKGILRSENRVIDRLLPENRALDSTYDRLSADLEPIQWQCVLGALLSAAAFWNPGAVRANRDAAATLRSTDSEIAKAARNLAKLIQRREGLSNRSGFSTTAGYHPVDFIDRAADLEGYGHYHEFLQEELHRLRGQYDLKYWPSMDAILQAIADDADAAEVQPNDPLTAAATRTRQASRRDFYRAWLAAIAELQDRPPAWLPAGFALPDQMVADLGNYALGDTDQWTSAEQIKDLRRDLRNEE
jgi:hypothetical protein